MVKHGLGWRPDWHNLAILCLQFFFFALFAVHQMSFNYHKYVKKYFFFLFFMSAVICPPLVTPPKSLLLTPSCGSTYGSGCRYSCQIGYTSFTGNVTRTCLLNGQWSGNDINCTGCYLTECNPRQFYLDQSSCSRTKVIQTKATAQLVYLEAQFKNHPFPVTLSDFPP